MLACQGSYCRNANHLVRDSVHIRFITSLIAVLVHQVNSGQLSVANHQVLAKRPGRCHFVRQNPGQNPGPAV